MYFVLIDAIAAGRDSTVSEKFAVQCLLTNLGLVRDHVEKAAAMNGVTTLSHE